MALLGMAGAHYMSEFVDRDKEFDELKRQLEQAKEGHGRLVFIVGEAGIGKTRLAKEFGTFAKEQGVRFLEGRCLYHENSDPYLPFIDAFRQYFQAGEGDDMGGPAEDLVPMGMVGFGGIGPELSNERMEELVPMGLVGFAGTGLEPEEERAPAPFEKIDLKEERSRMFETISQLISSIAERTPLLLFLDDLQWADNASLQLLHYVARNVQNSRVLLVGAYRPEDLKEVEGSVHPLTDTIRRMSLEKIYSSIQLDRLGQEHIHKMVCSLLEMQQIPHDFTKKLYEESEGNPFFVEEVLKSMVDEGIIDLKTFKLPSTDLSEIRIPRSIKDVISRRIARLDENSSKVLKYAAIIGNEFSFEVLLSCVEMDEEDLLDVIDKLMEAKLIHETEGKDDEVYRFDHLQIRGVVFDGLSRSRIRIMHKRVATTLEQAYQDRPDEVVYALAKNFSVGKVHEKALKYSLMAAQKALRSYAIEESIKYYALTLKALDALEETNERNQQKLDILLHLAHIEDMAGESESAMEHLKKSTEIGERLQNPLKVAEAYRRIGHILRERNEWDEATQQYEKSLEISEANDDFHGIADVYRGLGKISWRLGNYDEAKRCIKYCIENATKIDDAGLIGTSHIELGNVFGDTGDYQAAIEEYEKAIEILSKIDELAEIARAYNNMGEQYKYMGQFEQAIQFYESCISTSEKAGDVRTMSYGLLNAGECYARIGKPEKGKGLVDKAFGILQKLGEKYITSGAYMNYGIIHRELGEFEEAVADFEKAIAIMKEVNVKYDLGITYFEYGILFTKTGEKEKAKQQLLVAKKLFEEVGSKVFLEKTGSALEGL